MSVGPEQPRFGALTISPKRRAWVFHDSDGRFYNRALEEEAHTHDLKNKLLFERHVQFVNTGKHVYVQVSRAECIPTHAFQVQSSEPDPWGQAPVSQVLLCSLITFFFNQVAFINSKIVFRTFQKWSPPRIRMKTGRPTQDLG